MERVQPLYIRRIILEQSKRANVGHIGSALSIAVMFGVALVTVMALSSRRGVQAEPA